MHRYITRSAVLVAVPLLAGVAAAAPVTAAAAWAGYPRPAASFSVTGQLFGVAAVSTTSVPRLKS